MKKILVSLMIIALVCLLIGAGVNAAFSDTETSAGNSFTAGTLNLVPTISGTGPVGKYTPTAGGDGINGNVVFVNLVPGDSGSITWSLADTGNIGGTFTIVSTVSFTQGGTPTEPEHVADPTDLIGLDTNLLVWLTRDGTDILGTTSAYAAASGLQAVLNAESQTMVPTTPIVYVLHWKIISSVGNEIQGDTANIDITFNLNQ